MTAATPTLEDDVPGIRKRKWSPMKDESEDESLTGRSATDAREDSATPGTLPGSDTEASHKRPRLQDHTNPAETQAIPGLPATEIPPVPRLPLEVWQRVCSYLEPLSLGRLICVNRTLNALLDPQKLVPEQLKERNLTQNDIWSASRKRLLPGFPRPLSWISELDLWKLLLGTSCQFCGKDPGKASSITPSPWTAGPGQEGVRAIWPFAVRACGNCLTSRMTKDAALRFSDVSILLPGLPSAYFTPDLNFVTSIAIRASSPPLGLDLTRYYFQAQLDHLKQDMDHASSLGRAAAEEWVKGLDDAGKQKMEEMKRFEHWEATGGLQALLRSRAKHNLPPKHSLPAKPALPASALPSIPSQIQAQSSSADSGTQSPIGVKYPPSTPGISLPSGFNTPHLPLKPTSPAPGQHLPGIPHISNSVTHSQGPRGRLERNVGDVNQRKADRRAEIERRCSQLDPPIKSSTLPYMQAFNDAMQIPMALNDNAWEVLRPRLVAQHDPASKREEEFLAKNKNLQPQAEQRRENEEQLRQAQALLERQRDETQRPVREKLAAYADELIRSDWDGGTGIVKDNAPQFAADLLIYVRRKFFEALDESDKLLEAQGPQTSSTLPSGNVDRHLSLEDMKWVYETKIKPITQRYSKEIFLCGACDVDRKHYALDAVIQHYAAKHTNAFSHGSATVYWKADWPLEPPFDPKPIRSPRSRPADHSGVSPMYSRDLGRPQQHESAFAFREQTYPVRPGVAITPDMAPRPLARYAASAYSIEEDVYQPRSRLVPLQTGIPMPAMYGNGAAYETYYVPVTPASPTFSAHDLAAAPYRGYPPEFYQHPHPVRRHDLSMMSPAGMNGYGPQPPQIQGPRMEHPSLAQPGQPSGFHQIQIAELARNAREIWDGLDGIDNLPNSVRTHVIIHHVVLRFLDKYTNAPTLALFTDALLNNSRMKPLTNLGGLVCQTCASQSTDSVSSDHLGSQYNLPDLLKHFKTSHMEDAMLPVVGHTGLEVPRPDWKFDMVQLPDERTIKGLMHISGMTDTKLNLIATILSRYFPYPLPRLKHAPQVLEATASTPLANDIARPPSPSIARDGVHDYLPVVEHASNAEEMRANSTQDSQDAESVIKEIAREDEYDPHRPAPSHPGPTLDHEFRQPQPLYREPMRPYSTYDPRDASLPPYQPSNTVGRSFYEHPSYGSVLHRDFTPRRRYIEEEDDGQRRYASATSRYLYRPIRYQDRAFEDGRDRERERSPIEDVKMEVVHSPARNLATGTAQFLNDFDVGDDVPSHRNKPDEASLPDRASNNASSNRTGRAVAGSRHLRDRLDAHERSGSDMASRKNTPRKAISRGGMSARSRSPSVVPRDDPRNSEAPPYLRQSPNIAFDHEVAQQTQYSDHRYLERPVYEDELVPQYYEPVNRYRTRSPGRGQPSIPLRYMEARPLPQYRYSDEDLYERSGREYVQVMPRDGPQYIERRVVHDQFPEYVDKDGGYGRNIDDRDGQAYHGAPPTRREVRHGPYDDRRRYQ